MYECENRIFLVAAIHKSSLTAIVVVVSILSSNEPKHHLHRSEQKSPYSRQCVIRLIFSSTKYRYVEARVGFFFSFFSPWPTPIAVHGVVFANIRAKPICTRLTVSFRSAQSIVHPAHSMYSPARRNSIQLLRLLSAPNNRTARTYTPVIWWCQNGSRYSIRILCVQFRAGCRAVHITKVDTLPIIQPQTNKYKEYIQTLRSILSIFSVQTHKVTVDIFWNRRSSGVFAPSHRCSTANQIK